MSVVYGTRTNDKNIMPARAPSGPSAGRSPFRGPPLSPRPPEASEGVGTGRPSRESLLRSPGDLGGSSAGSCGGCPPPRPCGAPSRSPVPGSSPPLRLCRVPSPSGDFLRGNPLPLRGRCCCRAPGGAGPVSGSVSYYIICRRGGWVVHTHAQKGIAGNVR